MQLRVASTLFLFIAFMTVFQRTVAMNGELRIYQGANYKRLRRIIGVAAGNVCFDIACSTLNDITSSARWMDLPTTSTAFNDGQAKIAFYVDSNCTGKSVVVSTSVGGISNFANYGMDNTTSSFAVLETPTPITNGVANVCEWWRRRLNDHPAELR